jgi:hypothetical protein
VPHRRGSFRHEAFRCKPSCQGRISFLCRVPTDAHLPPWHICAPKPHSDKTTRDYIPHAKECANMNLSFRGGVSLAAKTIFSTMRNWGDCGQECPNWNLINRIKKRAVPGYCSHFGLYRWPFWIRHTDFLFLLIVDRCMGCLRSLGIDYGISIQSGLAT